MPLQVDLLKPIPGPNPRGADLRYSPIFDKIKEARREDDPNLPQGIWSYQLKKAEYPQVIRLTSEALASKTKDLQLAAWLTEALMKTESVAGLKDGLKVLGAFVDQFWDSVYPQLDEGDAEVRVAPLEWLVARIASTINFLPLTQSGLD